MQKKLNVGCGTDIKHGWVNMDSAPLAGVNVVHNIQNTPLPFEDAYFDVILCRDVLEHVEYAPVLRELHRILKTGGILKIQVPHFTSRKNYVDPTHKKLFSISTFDFFIENSSRRSERNYYFDFSFTASVSSRITFKRKPFIFLYNRLVSPLVNMRPATQIFYEETGLSRIFPAENIMIDLKK